MGMEDYTIATVIVAAINIVLLGIIISIYVQNLRIIKSYYTVGLVLVTSLLLIQNIVIIGFWQTLYMHSSEIMMTIDMISHYLFTITVVQTVGLSVLLWITRR